MEESKNFMYAHTLKGYPANFDTQIHYLSSYSQLHLVPTLKQIKEEQCLSWKWREEQGLKKYIKIKDYNYIRVKVINP